MGTSLTVYADGGARGNPGPAAIGVVLLNADGKVVQEIAQRIGWATNNQAEYLALIAGLEAALKLGAQQVSVRMDSELVVRQVMGRYAVRSPGLKPLLQRVRALQTSLARFSIAHVPRRENRLADALLNQALEEAKG